MTRDPDPTEWLKKLRRWRELILDGTPLAALREINVQIEAMEPKAGGRK